MSFDWNNYILLADELRVLNCKGGVEARLRASMSRGYYGIFHLVRQALLKEGAKFNAGVDVHQEVVQVLRTSVNDSRVKLGIDLGRLRHLRNSADYDDVITNVAQAEATASGLYSAMKRQISALETRGST